MRQRIIALVIVSAVAATFVAVAFLSGGGSHRGGSGSLRKLPIGSGAAGDRSSATGAAPMPGPLGVASMPVRSPAEIVVRGPLPDLASSATAYGFDGTVSASAVSRLASALGVHGDVTRDGDGFTVAGGAGLLQVAAGGPARWSYEPGCTLATGGGIQCTASGSAGVVVACAPPPCGPGETCPPPAPCDVKPPPRPAGLPSGADATKAALDVLAKAGIPTSGAETQVEDGWSQWMVVVRPVIDGRPVDGLETSVGIGPGSTVTSASGFLGRPTALGDYPLAGTTVGLERLRAGRWLAVGGFEMLAAGSSGGGSVSSAAPAGGAPAPMPAAPPPGPPTAPMPMPAVTAEPTPSKPAPPVPEPSPVPSPPDGPCDSCPGGEPVPAPAPPTTVTGVHLVLALVAGNDGGFALVPAYAFETDEGGTLPLVPAVTDDLLEQPAPTPVPDSKPPVGSKAP